MRNNIKSHCDSFTKSTYNKIYMLYMAIDLQDTSTLCSLINVKLKFHAAYRSPEMNEVDYVEELKPYHVQSIKQE